MEALLAGIPSGSLRIAEMLVNHVQGTSREGWEGKRTLTDCSAFSSFSASREMMMMLAPLAASCFATERPIPSDPPVMRTV